MQKCLDAKVMRTNDLGGNEILNEYPIATCRANSLVKQLVISPHAHWQSLERPRLFLLVFKCMDLPDVLNASLRYEAFSWGSLNSGRDCYNSNLNGSDLVISKYLLSESH